MKLVSLFFSLLALLLPMALWAAAKPIPNPPELDASSYFLIDFDSGQVLAEKNPEEQVEPASITKLIEKSTKATTAEELGMMILGK